MVYDIRMAGACEETGYHTRNRKSGEAGPIVLPDSMPKNHSEDLSLGSAILTGPILSPSSGATSKAPTREQAVGRNSNNIQTQIQT